MRWVVPTVCAAALMPQQLLASDPGTPTVEQMDSAENRIDMSEFGRCLIKKHHDEASLVISSGMTYNETITQFPDLIDENCQVLWKSSRPIDHRQHLIQYVLADALVQSDFVEFSYTDYKKIPPLHHRLFGPREALDSALRRMNNQALQDRVDWAASVSTRFGECVVRKDPENSHALLMTLPYSATEKSSFRALKRAGSECVAGVAAPWTSELSFDYVSLRGGIAVAYYRLAVAASMKSGEPVHHA